jgi:hypothetical protein
VPLETFLELAEDRELSLVVVNRDAPEPIQSLLESTFDTQSVTVAEEHLPEEDRDMVYLLEDGTVVASSPLAALRDAILLVNSDLYITGARDPEALALPHVIADMDGVRFRLRGYPESNKEKLLLITISRYIEGVALESEGGTHRSSFQRLSRIEDERGTRYVYERLADSPVETHVYGIPDWRPPAEFDVTMHGGWSRDFRESWFVLFKPDREGAEHAALLAIETEPRTWEGFWTYDPETVDTINGYVERTL